MGILFKFLSKINKKNARHKKMPKLDLLKQLNGLLRVTTQIKQKVKKNRRF